MVQLPVVPHTAKVVLNWRLMGQDVHNTLHYRNMNDGPPPSAAQLGPLIVPKVTADYRSSFSPSCALMSISAVPLDVPNAAGDEYSTGLPLVGSNIGSTLPSNVAAIITLRTALRGRSFRGRIYQPGVMYNGGNFNGPNWQDLGRWDAFWRSMLSFTINGDTVALAVVSYWSNKVLRPVGLATQVANLEVRSQYGTQRRRMP